MNTLVSVIIPVYNGEKSISISLDSLINQTYVNFEAIIIDDGSNDRTKEVIQKYTATDSRFKYYFQQNAGVSAARNRGIELAQGKYICFLDSDDFYEDTYLEKMLCEIEVKSADVCYCGYNVVSPISKSKKRTKFKNRDVLLSYILGRVAVHTTGWMIKLSLLEKYNLKFCIGVSWGEDFEFFCEVLSNATKIAYVKEYLTNYRVDFDNNSLSNFSIDKIDKDFESIMRIVSNRVVAKNENIKKALIEYRLTALITYRLLLAINKKLNVSEIMKYYDKYNLYLNKTTYNNGLRSIKLKIERYRLMKKIDMMVKQVNN